MSEKLTPTMPVLGGRTDQKTPPDVRHLFGSYDDPAGAGGGTFPDMSDLGAGYPSHNDCAPGLWVVSSAAREVQRYVAPPGTLTPLTLRQVTDRTPPAGSSVADRSALKLRIALSGRGYRREVTVDVGQPIEVYAQTVYAAIQAPAGTVEVKESITPEASGLVFDSAVGVQIMRLEQSIGARDAYLTETFVVPAATQVIREIPPGAREVVGYSDGDASGWEWLVGGSGPAQVWVVGELPWIQDAGTPLRRTYPQSVAPSATHIRTDSNGSARRVSLVWRIRP